jgi:hypothetical protein
MLRHPASFLLGSQHTLLMHFVEHCFISRPYLNSGSTNDSWLLVIALHKPPLMDALLACSAVRLAVLQPQFEAVATKHYLAAITTLREVIDNGDVNGTEDWLILIIFFLYFFEVFSLPLH